MAFQQGIDVFAKPATERGLLRPSTYLQDDAPLGQEEAFEYGLVTRVDGIDLVSVGWGDRAAGCDGIATCCWPWSKARAPSLGFSLFIRSRPRRFIQRG